MAQIKKDTSLRKAILQAAITGQLISNVEGESLPLAPASKLSSATPSAGASPATPPETGKQLLDRIIEERNNKLLAEWEEALKKNPKAKKPAPVVASEIDEDEIREFFGEKLGKDGSAVRQIPENWCWCRVKDIFLHQTGKTLNKDTNKEGIELDYLTTSNVYWNSFDFTELRTMKFKESEIERYSVKKGDLLILEGGEYRGRTAVWNLDRKVAYQNHLHRLRAYIEQNPYFYSYVMQAYRADGIIYAISKGEAIPAISSGVLGNLLIPLPPLAVQNAIVAKLEQVLPLVDAYENALLQKEELKNALPDKVKKAILQEAITGQLTEAWRKSATIKESGKQLLDRIIEERNAKALAEWEESLKKNPKAKKPVPVVASEIEDEEIPFEVPDNWCWCRLGDVGDFVRGSGIKRDETRPDGYPCIRYGEMYTRYKTVINETVSFVDKDVFDSCQKIIKNDIAMALTGENEYDIALAAVYTGDKEIAMGGDMTRFRPAFVNSLFLVFALNSPYGIECKSELATGNIIVHISNDKLGSIMIPLPPFEEQEEIVKKLEELLPLCK